jgi:hypothetical protein
MPSRNSNRKSPLSWFDSLEAVAAFAGDDYEFAVVPPAAVHEFQLHNSHLY